MKHYIIGHQKPDLDSVVSAISLADFFKQIGDSTGTSVITQTINPETEYIFKKFQITPPPILNANQISPEDKVLLVDHNEENQRLPGVNPDQISGIIDHHKANLNLNHPISISIKPWGSTNTIIFYKFKNHRLEINSTLAALMLSAILSDTVGLKSSTTTQKDREAVKELAKIAQIGNIDDLTLEIFKAKSNIADLNDEQIVKNDYKIFEFGSKKVFIGQLETVEQEEVISQRKTQLLSAMKKIKQEEGTDLLFLAISDILAVNTKLLLTSEQEKEIAEKAFNQITADLVLDIGAKISRKKEIAPAIEKVCQ